MMDAGTRMGGSLYDICICMCGKVGICTITTLKSVYGFLVSRQWEVGLALSCGRRFLAHWLLRRLYVANSISMSGALVPIPRVDGAGTGSRTQRATTKDITYNSHQAEVPWGRNSTANRRSWWEVGSWEGAMDRS